MNVDGDEVTEFTYGKNHRSTHQYSGKVLIRRETLMKLIELAPQVGEYEMLTLLMEIFDTLDVRCYSYDGYLRKITSVSEYYNTSMELLNSDAACRLFHEKKLSIRKSRTTIQHYTRQLLM